MPPELGDPVADAAQFGEDPWITPPIRMDYGKNVKLGKNVYFNFGCTFVDGCLISIGSRTLVGPNVSFYTGSHPLDPVVRNGTNGPEYGKEIHVGEDCWIGGNVILLPGVTLGYGVVVGAGSVVTKVPSSLTIPVFSVNLSAKELQDVPALHVVAGNPARFIKEIPRPPQSMPGIDSQKGAEPYMADLARDIESATTS